MMRSISIVMCWLAWAAFALLPLSGQQVEHRRKEFRSAPSEYVSETAGFDGSTTYIRRNNLTMTGITDTKVGTFSFWVNCQGGDDTTMRLFEMGQESTASCVINRTSANKIFIECRSTPGGTIRIGMTGSTSITASSGWKHIFIVVNVAGSDGMGIGNANNKIYVDGVAETITYNTNASDNIIDWGASTPRWTIGANGTLSSPGNKFNGHLSEFYFWNAANDIPSEFISGGKPVNLGATGNGSSAGTPDIYLSRNGSGNSWATDSSGNDNTFTATGTLSSPTAP